MGGLKSYSTDWVQIVGPEFYSVHSGQFELQNVAMVANKLYVFLITESDCLYLALVCVALFTDCVRAQRAFVCHVNIYMQNLL